MSEFEVKKIDEHERERIVAAAIDTLRRRGPDRVIIDKSGTALPPSSTVVTAHTGKTVSAGSTVELVYIREDGWTLGTPTEYAGAAQRMFTGQWVAFFTIEHLKMRVYEIERDAERAARREADERDKVEPLVGSIEDIRKAFKA